MKPREQNPKSRDEAQNQASGIDYLVDSDRDQEDKKRIERRTVNVGKYAEIAAKLLDEHPEVLNAQASVTKPRGGSGIELAMKGIPKETLNRFQGHGIVKGTRRDQLAAAISILSEGLMTGDTAELESDHYKAYRNGSFMVISKRDKDFMITNDGEFDPVDVVFQDGSKRTAIEIEIGALLCNDEMIGMADTLQEMFPDIPILRPGFIKNYLLGPPPPASLSK
jgi:hypothetical protein